MDNFKNSTGYTKHTIKKFLTKPQHPLVADVTVPHTTDKDTAPSPPLIQFASTDIPVVSGTNPTEGLTTDSDLASTPLAASTSSTGEFLLTTPADPLSNPTAALTFKPANTTAANPESFAPFHPSSTAVGGEEGAASTQPVPSFDHHTVCSTTQDEAPPLG